MRTVQNTRHAQVVEKRVRGTVSTYAECIECCWRPRYAHGGDEADRVRAALQDATEHDAERHPPTAPDAI